MKILFISHDATRTGAPILLLNLVKMVLDFNEFEVNFLLKRGGDLEHDFSKLALTYSLNAKNKSKYDFFKKKLFKVKSLVEDKFFLEQYDYIISNTITNGDILEKIRANYSGQIISYIHELEVACKTYTSQNSINKVIKYSDRYWVPTLLVKEFLCRELNINKEKVLEMPYFIDTEDNVQFKVNKNKNRLVVGGCGTIDWRKGPDLFLQVANDIFLKRPDVDIIFKWRGASKGIELTRLEYQVKMTNLEGKVFFEAATDDMDSFYQDIDLFLLTSREDPYPLVILEAAKYAKPSICFDKVCGSRDFINKSDGGVVIPFLDLSSMANVVLFFYDNLDSSISKGSNARDFLLKTHSNKEYVYNEFKYAIIN